mmetsp:Transcript_65442/g.98694  ORF Transcript_65442/g.98694 Transcript_65442/m.98694 type:complete len:371 (-) Transcript_65442:84-1196(-)
MVDRSHYEATAGKNAANAESNADLLPPDFVPGKWDVICQRGKECFEHVGNRRFRMCIDSHLDSYVKVKSRQQKSKIVTSIVQNIRKAASSSGGGFVRKDLLTRRWFKVDDKLAREKVGQALRDAIKTRRAADKKQSHDDVATADMAYSGSGISLTKQLNDEKNKELAFTASFDNSKQLQQHAIEKQQLSNFAAPPFFHSQLSAELEPTPIPQPYGQLPDSSGGNNAHTRSELSASSLLRLYESGSNCARTPNNTIFDTNRDFLRRNLAAELYAPQQGGTSGERRDNVQPPYFQQLLPTVIESRRLSSAMVDAGVGGGGVDQQNALLLAMKNDFRSGSVQQGNQKTTDDAAMPPGQAGAGNPASNSGNYQI